MAWNCSPNFGDCTLYQIRSTDKANARRVFRRYSQMCRWLDVVRHWMILMICVPRKKLALPPGIIVPTSREVTAVTVSCHNICVNGKRSLFLCGTSVREYAAAELWWRAQSDTTQARNEQRVIKIMFFRFSNESVLPDRFWNDATPRKLFQIHLYRDKI